MACSCSLAARPDLAGIDAALGAGTSIRKLVREGVSRSALGRHRKGCLGLDGAAEPPEGPAPPREPPEDVLPAAEPGVDQGTAGKTPRKADPTRDALGTGMGQAGTEAAASPGSISVDARARGVPRDDAHVKSLESFDDRANYLFDLAADGGWDGRRTARWLAGLWGIQRRTVQDMARYAEALARADRDTVELRRQTSIADTRDELQEAAKAGDFRAAAALRQHLDRIQGVLRNEPPQVQVNVLSQPGVADALTGALRVVQAILDRLHPGTSADVGEGLRAWQAGGSAALERWLAEREPLSLPEGE